MATRLIGAPEATDALAAGDVTMKSCVGTMGCAVAANVTGEPEREPDVAVTVCAPSVDPSVQVVCASPAASVAAEAGLTEPPPVATANVTDTPDTGKPSDAVTFTTSGCASGGADPPAA